MDRSLEFIAMCSFSHEVQRSWLPAHGDFFVGENGRIECWLSKYARQRSVRRGFGVQRREGVIHLSPYRWLPRLDQLMELAQVRGRRFEQTTQLFFDWTQTPYHTRTSTPGRYLKTLEQLWLAFVMQQKYVKFWDGKGWVLL